MGVVQLTWVGFSMRTFDELLQFAKIQQRNFRSVACLLFGYALVGAEFLTNIEILPLKRAIISDGCYCADLKLT